MIRDQLRKAKHKRITGNLEENNSKSTWQVVHTLANKNKKATTKAIYTLDGVHQTAATAAETINKYVIDIARESSSIDTESLLAGLPDYTVEVSVGQIRKWLRDIDLCKSTCSSDFPAWVSKLCHEDLCVPLCNLVNHCLRDGIFSEVLKQCEILPL